MEKNKGFVALMSAIIISILLLAVTFTLSFSGFFSRFNVLDTEFKKRSAAIAEACADTALLQLAQSATTTLPFDCSMGGGTGSIVSVSSSVPAAGQTTIKTKGEMKINSVQKVVTNLSIVASTTSASVISWEEIPTAP